MRRIGADAHLAGIAGVGMSALAQVLLDAGWGVSGSDRLWDCGVCVPSLRCLRRQGVRLWPQNGRGVDSARMLVVSSAIEPDNPDVLRANARGVPVRSRAEVLASLAPSRRLIAVAGTSGKSTTTAMLGWILAGAGADPTVVNGAVVPAWNDGNRLGSVRRGRRGGWWVVEVDESDRSLLRFRPRHAILTNTGADHFSPGETAALFAAFGRNVAGIRIDEGPDGGLPAFWRTEAWCGEFAAAGRMFRVPVPGVHNVSNAWMAVQMALALGYAPDALARAMSGFPGLERRLQIVGRCGPAWVVDDYAHNPDKIRAAWQALAGRFPRIAAVWRPHGYRPLGRMENELYASFRAVCRPGDRLWILPVYDAGGTAQRSVDSADLAARLSRRGVGCEPVATIDQARVHLCACAAPETVLAVLGARDPALPRLARSLVSAVPATRETDRLPAPKPA